MAFSSCDAIGQALAAKDLRMHADDQHFLVIGAVEDADPSALRQVARGAPQKIVLQFRRAGMLEAEDLAALRIDARHHVLDRAVLAGRVHRLKDQQHGIAVGGVEQLLLRAQMGNMVFQEIVILLLRVVCGLHLRRPFREIDVGALEDAKILGIDFHPDPFVSARPSAPTRASKPATTSKSSSSMPLWRNRW